jgi:hypothetical protein
MSVFGTKNLNKEHIKVRWKEPYVSSGLNKSKFGNTPRGVYSGFNIAPIGYREYQVNGIDPINFHGNPNSYNQGAYSSVSGYSIAVFDNNLGHAPSVSIPPGAVSGTFDFDFTGIDNDQRIIVLNVDYLLSNESAGQVLAVDASEMISNPEYLVLGVINIPNTGVSANATDIDYYDNTYPRTLPFATTEKYGFMSPQQALVIQGIGDEVDSLYCSSNDANVWWRLIGAIGRLDFTGNIALNVPTKNYSVQVTTSGDVVSGINDQDVVYFMYDVDGSVTGTSLLISTPSNLPTPAEGEQLAIFGIRCGNDFWFKNGQKWEVGEYKPFGVTSKSPNLKVGETGNPPFSDSVSGIFFDNANVTVLPGGRDVRVYVNVSGSIPEQPVEEDFIALDGQTDFTTTEPKLFWVLDDFRKDIKVYKNGIRLTPYLDSTSGLTYSDSTPIWEYKKIGTRTIQLSQPCIENAVINIRLEADKGYYADEEFFVVDSVTGQQLFTTVRPFNGNNDVKDVTLWRNGIKVQYGDLPLFDEIEDATKLSDLDFYFTNIVPIDSVVSVRWESSTNVNIFGQGGNYWSDLVDSDLKPDTDGVYDLGPNKRFRNANFAGDVGIGNDMYVGGKMYVSGGIDPTYLQFEPIDPATAPNNSIFVNLLSGNVLSFKNSTGTTDPVGSGVTPSTSGINLEEEELMVNPYPFDIIAPRAVSVSGQGNYFVLTDFQNPTAVENYFGILTTNVSAFGTGEDIAPVKWRGKFDLLGYNNGPIYVSGMGELVQDAPSVSGVGILKPCIIKNNVAFMRSVEGFIL